MRSLQRSVCQSRYHDVPLLVSNVASDVRFTNHRAIETHQRGHYSRSRSRCRLPCGLQQTVTAIAPPVDDVDRARPGVNKGEEGVTKQFHLLNRLVGINRLRGKGLRPHNLRVGRFLCRVNFRLHGGQRTIALMVAVTAALPFAAVTDNLPLHLGCHGVNRRMHIRRVLFGAQEGEVRRDCQLGDVMESATTSLFFPQFKPRLRHTVEEAVEATEPPVNIRL